MILIMRYTSVAMTRDGMRMFISADLDYISLTHTPRGQGVTDQKKIVALCTCILFSYLEPEYSRSTLPGISHVFFMQRAQLHSQKLGFR
jgi:hypothetical protein